MHLISDQLSMFKQPHPQTETGIKTPTLIVIRVQGIPKPGGSKKGFYNPKMKRVMIVDACDNKDWKTMVRQAGLDAYKGQLLDGLIEVKMVFYLRRPKCHYRSNGTLKPNAPEAPGTKPDVLKLARSTEDALTGVVWVDDSRTVHLDLHKAFGEKPGVVIRITDYERKFLEVI